MRLLGLNTRRKQALAAWMQAAGEPAEVPEHEPDVVEYLRQQFAKLDFDKSGLVDRHYLWLVVKKLHFHLSDAQVAALRTRMDGAASATAVATAAAGDDEDDVTAANAATAATAATGGGAAAGSAGDDMTLEEFSRFAAVLQEVMGHTSAGDEEDWCELPVRGAKREGQRRPKHTLHYNKRTGEARWTAPQDDVGDGSGGTADLAPSITEYLRMRFETALDSLPPDSAKGTPATTLHKMPLRKALRELVGGEFGLTVEQAGLIERSLPPPLLEPTTGAGVDVERWCSVIPEQLSAALDAAEVTRNGAVLTHEEELELEWCQLPTRDMWKMYWYNKRSGKTQWEEPQPAAHGGVDGGADGTQPPTLADFFASQMLKFDADEHTTMNGARGFHAIVKGMHLGLSDDQFDRFYALLEQPPLLDKHGAPSMSALAGSIRVTWGVLVESGAAVLREMYEDEEECFEDDWCGPLAVEDGTLDEAGAPVRLHFFANKRTGASSWVGPPSIVRYVDEQLHLALGPLPAEQGGGSRREATAPAVLRVLRGLTELKLTDDEVEAAEAALHKMWAEAPAPVANAPPPEEEGALPLEDVPRAFGAALSAHCSARPHSFEDDWCELRFDGSSRAFWYNKRSDHSRWKRPCGPRDNVPELGPYLVRELRKIDPGQSGTVGNALFHECLKRSRLGITPPQIDALSDLLRRPGAADTIQWDKLVEEAGTMLRKVQVDVEATFESDWCSIPGGGQNFWYNKRTAHRQWRYPPSLQEYLRSLLMPQGHSRSLTGELLPTIIELRFAYQGLVDSALRLEDAHADLVLQNVDKTSGALDAAVLVQQFSTLLKDVLEEDEGFRMGDEWVEIPVPAGGGSTFWYNKRLAFCQWDEPPNLRGRLYEEFSAADPDGTGFIVAAEFFELVKELYSLTEGQFEALKETITQDGDGRVDHADFVEDCFLLLSEVMQQDGSTWVDSVWCEVTGALADPLSPDNDSFWYNKLTGELQWTKPLDVATAQALARAKTELPTLVAVLRHWLGFLDPDDNGRIKPDDFWNTVANMLALGPEMIETLKKHAKEVRGAVQWKPFVADATEQVRHLYRLEEESELDWCQLKTKYDLQFWYDKRSGRAQWEEPAIVADQKQELVVASTPALKDYLAAQLGPVDVEKIGSIPAGVFWEAVKALPLYLADDEVHALRAADAAFGGESVPWVNFAKDCRHHLRELLSNAPDVPEHTVELLAPGSKSRTYFYNKKTGCSDWSAKLPSIKPYLVKEFRLIDLDAKGTCGRHAFRQRLAENAHLRLSPADLDYIEARIEVDSAGQVNWRSFVTSAPQTFSEMLEGTPEDAETEWCNVHPPGEEHFWYNKRREQSQWSQPLRTKPLIPQLGQSLGLQLAPLGVTELSSAVEWNVLALLSLALTPAQCTRVQKALEREYGHKHERAMDWLFVAAHIGAAITKAYEIEERSFKDDWCRLPAPLDRHFWYNKLTAEKQWQEPHISQWLAPGINLHDEVRHMVELLYYNDRDLRVLNCCTHKFGREGMALLASLLEGNDKLTSVSLAANHAGDEGAALIAASLPVGVTELDLWHNGIGNAAGEALAACLKKNHALTVLGLRANEFGPAGVAPIAEALKRGSLLSCIGLGDNKLGNMGCRLFAGALRRQLFWFNKRTSDVVWATPCEVMAEQRRLPTLEEYVWCHLSSLGHDCTKRELLVALQGIDGLNLEEWMYSDWCASVRACTGGTNAGTLDLLMFAAEAAAVLAALMEGVEQSFEADWCELSTNWCALLSKRGATYWYNKRSGETQWERPPNLLLYLIEPFLDFDVNAAGELKRQELQKMLKVLRLDLTYRQIAELAHKLVGGRGICTKQSFLKKMPGYLRALLGDKNKVLGSDWCELVESDRPYWYNKRTGQGLWNKPRVLLDYEAEVPQLREYLTAHFKMADTKATGMLSYTEYIKMTKAMAFRLSSTEIDAMCADMDMDRQQSVSSFVAAPEQKGSFMNLLKSIYASRERNPLEEWCVLPSKAGPDFWFNKRTAERQWEKPSELINAEQQLRKDAMQPTPDLRARLKDQLEEINDGAVTEEELWAVVEGTLALGPRRLAALRAQVDVVIEGQVAWEDFVTQAPELVSALFDMDNDNGAGDSGGGLGPEQLAADWVRINVGEDFVLEDGGDEEEEEEGGGGVDGEDEQGNGPVRKFWYNRRTRESQWGTPDAVNEVERLLRATVPLPSLDDYLAEALGRGGQREASAAPKLFRDLCLLPLALTPRVVHELETRLVAHARSRELIPVTDFAATAARIIRTVAFHEDAPRRDWVELGDRSGRRFWLCKRTGATQRGAPPCVEEFLAALFEQERAARAAKAAAARRRSTLGSGDEEEEKEQQQQQQQGEGQKDDEELCSGDDQFDLMEELAPFTVEAARTALLGSDMLLPEPYVDAVLRRVVNAGNEKAAEEEPVAAVLLDSWAFGAVELDEEELARDFAPLLKAIVEEHAEDGSECEWLLGDEWCKLRTPVAIAAAIAEAGAGTDTGAGAGTAEGAAGGHGGMAPRDTFWFNKRTASTQWEEPPCLRTRLAAAFQEADPESSGMLPRDVFFELVCTLLSLTEGQLAMLRAIVPVSINGMVSHGAFAAEARLLFWRACKREDTDVDFVADWCEVTATEELPSFWYNKRTGTTQREPCPRMEVSLMASLLEHAEPVEEGSNGELPGEDAPPRAMRALLFWQVVNATFGLTPWQSRRLHMVLKLHEKDDGKRTVLFEEPVATIGALLREVLALEVSDGGGNRAAGGDDEGGPDAAQDWCMLRVDGQSGRAFAYNRRSGATRWDVPLPPVEHFHPEVERCLLKSFRRTFCALAEQNSGNFWACVRKLPLDIRPEAFKELQQRLQRMPQKLSSWECLISEVVAIVREMTERDDAEPSPRDWTQVPLETALVSVDLSANEIGPRGAATVAAALRDNIVLKELVLSNNSVGHVGATALAGALHCNGTLETLELWGNGVRSDGAAQLADALQHNHALRRLGLRENEVGVSLVRGELMGAGAQLAKALATNRTLTDLDLWGNRVGDDGAGLVLGALETNQTLMRLNLRWNAFGAGAVHGVENVLRRNHTLTELDLWGNELGDEGAAAVAAGLKSNRTLISLNMRGNKVGDKGARALLSAMMVNRALVHLNIRDNVISPGCGKELHGVCAVAGQLERLDIRNNPSANEGIGMLVRTLTAS